ncbi:laccase domain-containing protein, partial [Rhizobium ruizarguesonis]
RRCERDPHPAPPWRRWYFRARIVACLGPSISKASYEVGPEFVERFVAENPEDVSFFVPSETPGHAMFKLPALTVDRL